MLMTRQTKVPLFQLGRTVATPAALEALDLAGVDVRPYMERHHTGDWGDLGREDKAANNEAVGSEGRIFSAYKLSDSVKIWIITEWDRSATTVLLPSDY